MPVSIVQIVQKMSPGGLEMLALRLADGLQAEHTIISLEGETEQLQRAWARLSSRTFAFEALGKRPGVDPRLAMRLYRTITRLEPDAVITHHAGPLLYAGPAARLAGVREHIHVEHDTWHLDLPRRRAVMRLAARMLRPKVVGVSERMRPALEDTYKGCDVAIVQNGVEIYDTDLSRDHARQLLNLPAAGHVIGAAGRLEEVKGHDVLISALARLPRDVTLIIAGDGSQRARLESEAARLSVSDRVRFLGHREDLEQIYPAMDVYCQPSRNEGLPLAILEAQARGVRVVASAVGDVAAGVCPRSGELVPPGDDAALARALSRALSTTCPSPIEFIASKFDFRHTVTGYARLIGGL